MNLETITALVRKSAEQGGPGPVFLVPLAINRTTGRYYCNKLEWNFRTRDFSFAKMDGVDMSDYAPVCAWRYGGMVYRRRR